jgi:hypothetical protein
LFNNQKNAWVDSEIFNEFLPSGDQFLKLLNLQKKAFVVIDNELSHPDEDTKSSGDIIVIFLLPKVT